MTPSEARTEISNLAVGLFRSGLAATVNTPVVAPLGASTVRVTWPAAGSADQVMLSDLPFASITAYRKMFLGNQFTALMKDGALLQISVDINRDELVGHRFGYYPCPILIPEDFDVLDFDALDLLLIYELEANLQALETGTGPVSEQLRMRSPLRFDFAPDAATADEPASHVYLVNRDSRIAVQGPLSIGDFVRFIFKHVYQKAWNDQELSDLMRWPLRDMNRTITVEEESALHVNCRRSISAVRT